MQGALGERHRRTAGDLASGYNLPASSINIERGSRWTILETERESPRIARRQPFSTEHVADANSARADGAWTAAKHLAAATLA